MIAPQKTALTQKRGFRQLIKFAIVGASSTVINLAVLYLMLRLLHGHRYISTSVAFLVSVVNGYHWNRTWTFKAALVKAVHTQFAQFALVNLVGYALDLLVIYLASVPLEHQLHLVEASWSPAKIERVAVLAAQLIATAVIVFWNFFANRLWTFKH
jgi:putative flippase GtrA